MKTASGTAVIALLLLLFSAAARADQVSTEAPGNATREDAHEDGDASLTAGTEEAEKKLETAGADSEKEADQESSRNASLANGTLESGFMPSFHLGPIAAFPDALPDEEAKDAPDPGNRQAAAAASNNPFNNVRTIKFESGKIIQPKKQPQSYRPSEKIENFVKFVEQTMQQYQENFGERKNQNYQSSDQRYGVSISEVPPPPDPHRDYHAHHRHQHQPPSYAPPDESYGNERPPFGTYWTTPATTNGYAVHHPPAIVSSDNHYPPVPADMSYPAEQHYHHYPLHPAEHQPPYFPPDQPPSQYGHYHIENQEVPPDDKSSQADSKPETVINVHPVSYQATSLDALSHPKTIIYVTAHEMPKPPSHNNPSLPWPVFATDPPALMPDNVEQHFSSVFSNQANENKSVSPWRRILHVIGTFLPLGLLIALLSPRVINSSAFHPNVHDNGNNEPNIILSKLRVNDLPAEHKHGQLSALDTGFAAEPAECEERAICRLLAAADSLGANFLRHLLLHFAERTLDSAVRKKELDGIFEAARLGKCDTLTCNFYDGT